MSMRTRRSLSPGMHMWANRSSRRRRPCDRERFDDRRIRPVVVAVGLIDREGDADAIVHRDEHSAVYSDRVLRCSLRHGGNLARARHTLAAVMDSNASRQLIVVGAGGLVAAKRLSDRGLDVLVLEARERVEAVSGPTACPMARWSSGGEWISTSQGSDRPRQRARAHSSTPAWTSYRATRLVVLRSQRWSTSVSPGSVTIEWRRSVRPACHR